MFVLSTHNKKVRVAGQKKREGQLPVGEARGKRVENVLARQERQARPAFLPFCTSGEKDNCHLNPLYEKYTKYFEITRVAPLKIQKSISHKFKPSLFRVVRGDRFERLLCHSSRTRISSSKLLRGLVGGVLQ